MDSPEQARAQAEQMRRQMEGTLSSVKARLSPRALTQEVVDKTKERAADMAHAATEAVKARPAMAVSVLAATALLLFRKPLKSVIKKIAQEKRHG
jgi:ElaB/YqjD/DUF883 family membrane-anchored ribosome-binding protein